MPTITYAHFLTTMTSRVEFGFHIFKFISLNLNYLRVSCSLSPMQLKNWDFFFFWKLSVVQELRRRPWCKFMHILSHELVPHRYGWFHGCHAQQQHQQQHYRWQPKTEPWRHVNGERRLAAICCFACFCITAKFRLTLTITSHAQLVYLPRRAST